MSVYGTKMLLLRTGSFPYHKCPGCHRMLRASLSSGSSNDSSTAFDRLQEKFSKKSKQGKKSNKYVEVIQVKSQEGSNGFQKNEAVKRLAKIKKSSATNVLQKLGVEFNKKIASSKIDDTSWFKDEMLLETNDPLLESNLSSCANIDAEELYDMDDAEQELHAPGFSNPELLPSKEYKFQKDKETTSIANSSGYKISKPSSWITNLFSYVDVCIQNDWAHLAQRTVLFYHNKRSLAHHPQSTDILNLILHGWANKMDYLSLQMLLGKMEAEGPRPNLQSYATAIECAVRVKKHKSEIQHILEQVKDKGLNVDDIYTECKFVRDQREIVVKGIRTVLPEFNPKPATLDTDYCCGLVDKLNPARSSTPRYYSPMGESLNVEQLKDLSASQIAMESEGQAKIKSIAKKSTKQENYMHWRKVLKECECDWRKTVKSAFENNLKNLENDSTGKYNKCSQLLPYLSVMPVETYVDYIMQEIEKVSRFSESFSPSLSILQYELGTKVMDRYFLETKKKNGILDKMKMLYNEYNVYYCTPELTSKYTSRQYWEILLQAHCNGADIDFPDKMWPPYMIKNVGRFLFNIVLQSIKIDANIMKTKNKKKNLNPAFYTVYRNHNVVKVVEEIKPNPVLVKLYNYASCDDLTFNVNLLPMVSPPRPWVNVHSGGFLFAHTTFVRLAGSGPHSRMMIEKTKTKDLFPVFDSLNYLGECPWRINERVLDIVIKIFNEKGSVELGIPQHPSECPRPEFDSEKGKAVLMRKRAEYNQRKAEMHSLRCDMLYKLSIANEFRHHILWFPQNLDFRSRVYPCPPHLNHLGNDVCRAMLLFAKGEKLGDKGLQWLKIHLVNLTGTKKRSSLEDRLKYCNESMEFIMDSADNPLVGGKWWAKSDEPWQTLACCMELTSALRSSCPHDYVSHFPVHQDGSCNGLQHYAALGRDVEGADQVNLVPREVPQDVYSRVAEMVEIERAKDANSGSEIAKALDGFISRKVVKQPVMTTVYGVTYYGARTQIMKRLKEIPEFPADLHWKASSYLVKKTFRALEQMFSATKKIQDWLNRSARLLSSSCHQPVKWKTPLGFPVYQPYMKLTKGLKKKKSAAKEDPVTEIIPNVMKQVNGFAPNYIHSLDSSHMMMTSLFCQRAGITFISVHDCFWTHPNAVDVMNLICREQFVSLHSQPLLSTLSDDMLKTQQEGVSSHQHDPHVSQTLSDIPLKGSFNLLRVIKSAYFFS